MADKIVHGLIQKALLTANELHSRYRIQSDGALWEIHPTGWIRTGTIARPQDREDFLLSKLTQEGL